MYIIYTYIPYIYILYIYTYIYIHIYIYIMKYQNCYITRMLNEYNNNKQSKYNTRSWKK